MPDSHTLLTRTWARCTEICIVFLRIDVLVGKHCTASLVIWSWDIYGPAEKAGYGSIGVIYILRINFACGTLPSFSALSWSASEEFTSRACRSWMRTPWRGCWGAAAGGQTNRSRERLPKQHKERFCAQPAFQHIHMVCLLESDAGRAAYSRTGQTRNSNTSTHARMCTHHSVEAGELWREVAAGDGDERALVAHLVTAHA